MFKGESKKPTCPICGRKLLALQNKIKVNGITYHTSCYVNSR